MHKALRNGIKLSLRDYIDAENGEQNPERWLIKPVCCGNCQTPLYAWGISRAVQWVAKADDVTPRQPGFHHWPGSTPNCEYSRKDDPGFRYLEPAQDRDAEIRNWNLEVLRRPEIRAQNRATFRFLMKELTGQHDVPEALRARLDQQAHQQLYTESYLHDHPWLLPYRLVTMLGHHQRHYRSGVYTVAFREDGTQSLSYRDIDGKTQRATVPRRILMKFVNKSISGKVSFKSYWPRYRPEPIGYDLSATTASHLAAQGQALVQAPKRPLQNQAAQNQDGQQLRFSLD